MKRSKWIAAAWIAGMTAPAFAATIFLIGCCALPFHGVIHKMMPLCRMASHVMRGQHGDNPAPVPEKQNLAKRAVKFLHPSPFPARTVTLVSSSPATTLAAYRSFVALGAMRCDDDVGTRLANLDTLRI